jgi:hypothetical protein
MMSKIALNTLWGLLVLVGAMTIVVGIVLLMGIEYLEREK